MNEIRKTRDGSNYGVYCSPEVKVVLAQSEGVLCSSGLTEKFEDGNFNWD